MNLVYNNVIANIGRVKSAYVNLFTDSIKGGAMKIYRVNYQTKKELKNNGYAFFASKGAATTAKRAVEGCKGSIDILELDKSKDGIINFLNTYANHSKES